MARAGDEIINPATGVRMIFRQTASETGDELLQMDWIGKPGWKAGPPHVHRYQEERFEVLSGTLGSHLAGIERIHEAGEVVTAPAGSVHTVWNAGQDDEEVHALVEFRPAGGGRSEIILETVAGLAQDGKTTKTGLPKNPLQLALIVHDYEDEIYLAQPPLVVQRAIFGALASIGRLLGYHAEYPYPYGDQEELGGLEDHRTSMSPEARIGALVAGTVLVFLAPFLLRVLLRSRRRQSRR